MIEWQQTESIHPLTCGNDSTHALLKPIESEYGVRLECSDCPYHQEIPSMVLAAWRDGSLDSHRKAVDRMQKAAKCRHEYEGNFKDGWTCRLCDRHSKDVQYFETVDGQEKRVAIEKGEEKLRKEISQMLKDGICKGLALALTALQSGTYKTVDEAVLGISDILGEFMLKKEGNDGRD